ncbi:hypothetical protein VTJ83DRAFT_2372 [Remersonia thermophila]|uniref:Small ribosomal subunit protein mS29 n=1 Tax=Remersonia thermophila TaxID=72144 RepID=A0ABR4DIJ2_9PEZI
MSAPNCLRCLVRPSAALRLSAPPPASALKPATPPLTAAASRRAPFSTTPAAAAAPKSSSQGQQAAAKGHVRKGKRLTLKGKKKQKSLDHGKSPLPGERKAYRKRITLSNDNAIKVPWLTDLAAPDLADPANVGKVLALPPTTQDQLRASEAFKPTQTWGMFRQPAVLVRKETVDLTQRMQEAAAARKVLRMVVTGNKVTGKSLMLLQAMTHAFLNEWVVIHLPEAQELTTAVTEYAPLADTSPVQYSQPVYALKLLHAIRKANADVLAKTFTVSEHSELPQSLPAGSPLLAIANQAKEVDSAWVIFQALWNELMAPAPNRPPILLSLDGLAHVMRVSDYRSPAFEPIHAFDLALVRLFTDALGGAVKFPAGGAVLGATSRNNSPRSPSMELALAQREAEQQQQQQPGVEVPQKDPFFRGYDERVDAVLRSVQVLRLGGVDRREARALLEYWAASGMLRTVVDEKAVAEKWTLAGGGVLGEMERASLLTMRV